MIHLVSFLCPGRETSMATVLRMGIFGTWVDSSALKCLACKLEDPSSIPITHILKKEFVTVVLSCDPGTGKVVGTEGSMGLT